MFIWGLLLVYASLNIQTQQDLDIKDLLGWATGLLMTALVWKLHTAVHKGLVQLWRYGKGERTSKPKPEVAPKVRVAAASADGAQ